jgi:eukaryotic translation initiation factor 2C
MDLLWLTLSRCETFLLLLRLNFADPTDLDQLFLFKSLATQYFLHTGKKPFRVLIYRDGASEGSFDSIVATEVKAVRRALYDLNSGSKEFSCCGATKCKSNGCIECTQPITYLALQSDHNVRIVPTSTEWKNVPSGTVVDSLVTSFQNGLHVSRPPETPTNAHGFPGPRENGSDFLLTAQGGLKGTSKPMYYRVLLNENIQWRPLACPKNATQLTRAQLEKLTYHMAFQCK